MNKNKKNINETSKDFDTLIKDIRKDIVEDELKLGKKELNKEHEKKIKSNLKSEIKENVNINDKIQSVVSILFTIVIFILMLFLIIVLYNQYLKKDKEIDLEEVCSSYIKHDLDIKDSEIIDYIKDNRYIIYNINEYDSSNIDHETINNFSRFIIWNSDLEYSLCNDLEYCLDTKKEMDYDTLKEQLKYYFNLDSLNLIFDYNFSESDATRLFIHDDKVILTFKGMEYTTLKHDIVDIRVEENKIYVIFALSKKIDNSNYAYTGSKKMELEYINNKFILKSINTVIN